jgi:uncharacterized membrane protein YqaE (UPF0057 family)
MVDTIVLVIIAFFIPPLAVYLHENACNNTTILNLILTILFWLPGTYNLSIYFYHISTILS